MLIRARRRGEGGQFIPISAMVMFAMVVVMVAVIDIYKVSRAKLKVQNLADAAALNIASQEAQEINVIADRNEWLNHLYANNSSAAPGSPGASNPCANNGLLPGISCVESYIFNAKISAKAYALNLIKPINDAQNIFKDTYNTFIGAGPVAGFGKRSLKDILTADIPDLNDPAIHLIAWNKSQGDNRVNQILQDPQNLLSQSNTHIDPGNMGDLNFQPHDTSVQFYEGKGPFKHTVHTTFRQLILGETGQDPGPIGWMELDDQKSPTIRVGTAGRAKSRIGASVYVQQDVSLLGMSVPVGAKSSAYVVSGSGKIPLAGKSSGVPVFQPTYWVKLGDK